MNKAFSDLEISDFCNATRDPNLIHNPKFMRDNGKLAIVPGMLTFAYAANMASDFLLNNTSDVHVVFGNPVSSGDNVKFGVKQVPFVHDLQDYTRVTLSADSPQGDALASYDQRSTLSPLPFGEFANVSVAQKQFDVSFFDVQLFENIIEGSNKKATELLYAIAFASNALLTTLKKPIGESEQTVSNLLTNNGSLPVYKSLKIMLPVEFQGILEDQLSYQVVPSQTGKRDFNFYVTCKSGKFHVFHANYEITAVPEKMIMKKVAKDYQL